MDELAIKRQYSEQINRLNASAKAKNIDLFVKEWTRIPRMTASVFMPPA